MKRILLLITLLITGCAHYSRPLNGGTLVLMTDFGVKDGAVSAMKGVAHTVDPQLFISDLTHEVTPYHIWEAAYRLEQTAPFWKAGTVFVTVVDPGVGSQRKPIAARRFDGSVFIGPDNGHLTLLDDQEKFAEVRIIDESRHRLKGSSESYTFHGRDLFVYVGARIAAGQIQFADVGPRLSAPLERLNYKKAEKINGQLKGTIVVLDPNYGNVWTNIPKKLLVADAKPTQLKVKIQKGTQTIYSGTLPFVNTFADVPAGKPLAYFNSLLNLSFALNMDSFAKKYKIGFGPEWSVVVTP